MVSFLFVVSLRDFVVSRWLYKSKPQWFIHYSYGSVGVLQSDMQLEKFVYDLQVSRQDKSPRLQRAIYTSLILVLSFKRAGIRRNHSIPFAYERIVGKSRSEQSNSARKKTERCWVWNTFNKGGDWTSTFIYLQSRNVAESEWDPLLGRNNSWFDTGLLYLGDVLIIFLNIFEI